MNFICYFVLCAYITLSEQQQRVAPGVPPQHYQGVPPQHQQPPPQYQQVPIQQQPQHVQQQIPVQHVPVQQVPGQPQIPNNFQQQVPHQQPHHGGHHSAPGQILNAANVAQEKEHIAEHFQVPIDTSKMSEQELQFHYFKMHDADNNNKLDGCELVKSLIHWHESEEEGNQAAAQTDDQLSNLIDPILLDVDADKDGFVDYTEFKNQDRPKRHS